MANIGTAVVNTFGAEDIAIKLPSGTADVWTDVPAVVSAAYKSSVSKEDVWGDDSHQDVWFHSAQGQLVVKCSKTAMRVLEMVTGVDAVSSGAYEKIQIQSDPQLTPPAVAVKFVAKARTALGTTGRVTVVLYKCRVDTAWESYPDGAHGKPGELTLTFTALRSDKDENNTNSANTLPSSTYSFGRIELPNN